jgi:small subunit ribosomal protein S4e
MGKKQHLSRLAAPRTWPVKRKITKWIAKPTAGAHTLTTAMPLVVIARDLLRIVDTSKELKGLLHSKSILVNNRSIRDVKFSVGLFDVIMLPKIKTNYRIVLNKQGKLVPIKVADNEASTILLRIENKKAISKKKTQINFNNGWNILVDTNESKIRGSVKSNDLAGKDTYKTHDVIVFDTKSHKITSKLSLEKGVNTYLIGGKHAGTVAKFVEVQETGTLRKHKVAKLQAGKDHVESALRNIMIVGKDKPLISLN